MYNWSDEHCVKSLTGISIQLKNGKNVTMEETLLFKREGKGENTNNPDYCFVITRESC